MGNRQPALDPRVVGGVVVLLGATAMFMNKAMTAHGICAVAAVYLAAARAYKSLTACLVAYIAVAFLMANVDEVHSTNVMLLIVSLSYFAQKLLVLFMMGGFFVHMTTIPLVLSAMQHMRTPDAVAVPIMVALRFFPTMREDYRSLKDSLRVRRVSLSPLQFIAHPVRMMEYLFVPILMRGVRTSDELAASALLRGFEHLNEQTILHPLKLRTRDRVVAALSILIAVALFYAQFT